MFILAILAPNHSDNLSCVDVSDSEGTVVGDSFSDDSYDEDDTIFKPKIERLRFASIEPDDIVELTCVKHNQLYIRSTKNDEKYENLLKITNQMIAAKRKPSMLQPLKDNDVIRVKFGADYSRAVVREKDSLIVELIDIGDTLQTKSEDIFYMSTSVPESRMVTPVLLNIAEMSKEEDSAVNIGLNKWLHNRFIVKANGTIQPNSVVDLVHIVNGESLTNLCQNIVSKVYQIDDIACKKVEKARDIDLKIIDNSSLRQGVISCVLLSDFEQFAKQAQTVTQFGQSVAKNAPFKPKRLEICLVYIPDDDGTAMWYRGQYQQELQNRVD